MTTKPVPQKITIEGDIATNVRKRGYRLVRRFGSIPTPGDEGTSSTTMWPVLLWQHAVYPDRFAVSYGAELTYCLDWVQAAERLGAALLHTTTVDGKINDD